MNVLLCSISSKYIHSSLSVWYLLESVRENCGPDIAADVLECTVNQPEKEIVQRIADHSPDILAFSCYIWNISLVLKILPQIKKLLPKPVIIFGGPEVSHNPKEVLQCTPDVDYIITGEGEKPFPELLSRLQLGADPVSIPSLCLRKKDGSIQCNPPATPLPEPPSPYSDAYLRALSGRIAYLETSRGCPFSCAFCLSGINEQSVRFFDLEQAKQDMLLLANSGAQTVKLVDRTFNCNPERAYELFNFIIQNAGTAIPQGVCFHFEVAADLFNAPTLELLSTAPHGLIQLEAGLQTFNQNTLEAVSRKTDLSKLEKNIRTLLAGKNIHLHIDLIAGLPFEGLDSFADSFNRAYGLSPHMLQLGLLKMLHGSSLRGCARELGYRYSPLPPYEVLGNPWHSNEDLQTISFAKHALQKLYNSGRFLLTTRYVLTETSQRPFDLFAAFGEHMSQTGKTASISLNDFVRIVYDYFDKLPGIDPKGLRDALVCDLIACGNKIPAFLKIPDNRLKSVLNEIKAIGGHPEYKGYAALLYANGHRAVYACGTKDPVSGRHPLCFIPLEPNTK